MGLADAGLSEEKLEQAKAIIKRDLENIEQDFRKQLHRLDSYIKKNIGAIPREDDFVKWFFDKKKINETGKNLSKITDEEIICYAKKYVEELHKYVNFSDDNTFLKLNYGPKNPDVIKLLYNNLNPEKIEISFSDFEKIFNSQKINEKIHWKGTEIELVSLFTSIKFENRNIIYVVLSNIFLNKKNRLFSVNQLSVSKSKSTCTEYKAKSFVEKVISQIKKLEKS